MKPSLLILFISFVVFPTANSQETECLQFGWPGLFQNSSCEINSAHTSFDRFLETKKECRGSEQPCNPALFGPGLCIERQSKESNISCLEKAKVKGVESIAKHLVSNQGDLDLFDELYIDLQVLCDEFLGSKKNQTYCEEVSDWVESLADKVNQLQGVERVKNPLGDLIVLADQLDKHRNQEEVKLGETSLPAGDDPAIFDGPRASALNISDRERVFIDNIFPQVPFPRERGKSIVLKFPKGEQRLELFKVKPGELIPYLETKEFFLKFEKTQNLAPQAQLDISGHALAQELVERLRTEFDPSHKKEIVSLINSLDKEDWKKLLLGEEGDIFRFAGLLELRRGIEGLDEDLEVTIHEKYAEGGFEGQYFIPTGFIEVGQGQYLKIQDLVEGKIEIDPKKLKVKILKNVTLYIFTEINQNEGGDKDLNALVEETLCQESCDLPAKTMVGDIIEIITKIQVQNKEEVDQANSCLLQSYIEACPNLEIKQRLNKLRKKLKLEDNCHFR